MQGELLARTKEFAAGSCTVLAVTASPIEKGQTDFLERMPMRQPLPFDVQVR